MVIEYTKDLPASVSNNFWTHREFWALADMLCFKHKPNLALAIRETMDEYREEIRTYPASVAKHHWWSGGYVDHLCQMLTIVDREASAYCRVSGANKDDVLAQLYTAVFLHDLEKLTRYRKLSGGEQFHGKVRKMAKLQSYYKVKLSWGYVEEFGAENSFLTADLRSLSMAAKMGFPMDEWLVNAICFAAGGFSDIARKTEPNDIAVILHMADYASANLYFNIGCQEE